MRLLLDTCVFLWAIEGGRSISTAAREAMRDADNDVYLSAVSTWEIAVKHGLGKLSLPAPPWSYIPVQRSSRGIDPLPLDETAALHVARLPDIHRDPFDRMLVAQALVGDLVIVTPDAEIARYPVRTLW